MDMVPPQFVAPQFVASRAYAASWVNDVSTVLTSTTCNRSKTNVNAPKL